MGANLVAQQVNWSMIEGWMQGENAANAYYEPIGTFAERFGAFVDLVVDSGFETVDVWTGQLNWAWASPAHFAAAQRELARVGIEVASYVGYFGDTVEEFSAAAAVAHALGTSLLSGSTSLQTTNRPALVDVLETNGLRLAIENHTEKTPSEIVEQIGDDGRGLIGTAVDTGWWGTQGFNSAEAILELGAHVLHVHFKDVLAEGAHDTCALGDGVVPIEDSVKALNDIGFNGPISIEHEPEHSDPAPAVAVSRERLVGWLADAGREWDCGFNGVSGPTR